MNHRSASFPPYSFSARMLLASAAFLLLSPVIAQADLLISKSLGDLPTSTNLNDFTAWAYYADTTVGLFDTVSNTHPTTNNLTSANFSALSGDSSVLSDFGYSQNMVVTYSGGTSASIPGGPGGSNPTTESSPGVDNYDFTVGGLTMSTKLIATTETLHFYLYAYDGASDLSLTLGSQSIPLYSNTVLPEVVNGSVHGSGDNIGELSVTVQGAIGDTLVFTDSANNSDVSGNGHTGLEAVTVQAIPEPSTYALMLGGLALIGFCARRKLA